MSSLGAVFYDTDSKDSNMSERSHPPICTATRVPENKYSFVSSGDAVSSTAENF